MAREKEKERHRERNTSSSGSCCISRRLVMVASMYNIKKNKAAMQTCN
jgi:hypothetical protein